MCRAGMAKRLRDILLMFRDIPPTGTGNRAETEGVETCLDGRTGWLPRGRTCARWRGLLCLCGGRGVPGRLVYLPLRVGMGREGRCRGLAPEVARLWPEGRVLLVGADGP